jgi:dolichol kinase
VAALVGISLGRVKIGKKSLEGTVACFITCFLIGIVLFWRIPLFEYVALVGAMSAAIVELWAPLNVDDNFTIPVLSAVMLQMICWRIQMGVYSFCLHNQAVMTEVLNLRSI